MSKTQFYLLPGSIDNLFLSLYIIETISFFKN